MPKKDYPLLPGIVLRSISGGMILMALLTYVWAGLAISGLQKEVNSWRWATTAFSILILIIAIYFFIESRHFPKINSADDKAEGKNMGKWYGILFGAEGLIIAAACTTLALTGHPDFILPSVALIVGLHFYPMAKIFKRTIDYYIATWTCLVGLTGIYWVFKNSDPNRVHVLTGFGMATATAAYALYMLSEGFRILSSGREVHATTFNKNIKD